VQTLFKELDYTLPYGKTNGIVTQWRSCPADQKHENRVPQVLMVVGSPGGKQKCSMAPINIVRIPSGLSGFGSADESYCDRFRKKYNR